MKSLSWKMCSCRWIWNKISGKAVVFVLLYTAAMTGFAGLLSVILFKNTAEISRFLGGLLLNMGLGSSDLESVLEQLAEALSALKEAEYAVPWVLTGIVCLLCGILLALVCFSTKKPVSRKKTVWKCIAVTALGAVFLVLEIGTAMWYMEVNSMRFGCVAESLWQVSQGKSGGTTVKADFDISEDSVSVWKQTRSADGEASELAERTWTVGFGSSSIIPEKIRTNPLYIAGYNNDWPVSQYLVNTDLDVYENLTEQDWERMNARDYAQARAVWLDTGEGGVLLIGIDTIAVSSNYVQQIREKLQPLCEQENCVSVNVYATHSHALPDTLGLWGPVGVDGKDQEYMEKLVDAAVEAAQQAAENRHQGTLYYGSAVTDGEYLLRDSRYPYVYDEKLHQLRFEGEDGYGVRLFFYGAHAESMRGDNKLLSRDFPGVMCDLVTAETGDQTMFIPGAIGGLIMTEVLVSPFDAAENMQLTGRIMADYALSIQPETEKELEPVLNLASTEFTVPLDNNAFLYYQFLGILRCNAVKGESRTGYLVQSEMSLIQLDSVTLALIPGEIFPELVYGGRYGDAAPDSPENPAPLQETAFSHGAEQLLVVGLANDELGYIVPPSDFLVNETNPYLERTEDARGEDHYEETNSVGPECANAVAQTFERLLEALDEGKAAADQ